jgi:hypothetical protein
MNIENNNLKITKRTKVDLVLAATNTQASSVSKEVFNDNSEQKLSFKYHILLIRFCRTKKNDPFYLLKIIMKSFLNNVFHKKFMDYQSGFGIDQKENITIVLNRFINEFFEPHEKNIFYCKESINYKQLEEEIEKWEKSLIQN